jgi:molybdate-binding protein
VRQILGTGYQLLRVTRWEEELALAPSLGLSNLGSALRADLNWIGREEGSSAGQCLDELMEERGLPLSPVRVAFDHQGITEAIRCGWAEVGVCLRLPVEEAGLDFLEVRQEAYDLCFATIDGSDPRIRALAEAVRSLSYRRSLAGLPGYDPTDGGEIQTVG